MKTFAVAVLFAAAFAAAPAMAEPVAYKIDPGHTSVAFIVNHLGFSNTIGRFNTVAGELTFDQADVAKSKLSVTIDAAGVDTNHAKRDEHLRSPDFFNVKEFPKLTFKSVKIEKTGDNTGALTGDFTMLGVTKPLTLAVTFNKSGVSPATKLETVGFSARGVLKRTDFGMKYGAPYISDEIQLLIETEATK
jgi:polyisoprenoid-binding protein YceI